MTPAKLLVRVTVEMPHGNRQDSVFESTFLIGRDEKCGICIKNDYVSRHHAEVTVENGEWLVRDLGSSNGIYFSGSRSDVIPILGRTTIRLGIEGPFVSFAVERPPAPPTGVPGAEESTLVSQYVDHYFGNPSGDQAAGEHTMLVRRAFSRVQNKQKRKYWWIMSVLGLAILAIGTYSFYLHQEASKNKELARNLFYAMKSVDVDIANVEKLVTDSNLERGMREIRRYQSRRQEMQRNYDQFLKGLRIYDPKMTPEERLILRVARIFGECELAMPPDFMAEIKTYIQKWKSSGRFARDLAIAKANNYAPVISKELLAQDLPPQFFYLALQESDFDPYASGPPTRKGFAKGMWQFIPETAVSYGLKIGPLVDLRRPDPADDRHHWDRETKAAVRYMKDLYSTDAQASGLLVMACYNWGEGSVLPLVRKLPANPRERNFWQLLAAYKDKVPKETYDYVFYIVSAAVIGENPRLFGFDFDNPLAQLESK